MEEREHAADRETPHESPCRAVLKRGTVVTLALAALIGWVAGTVAILAFAVGYDPTFFRQLISAFPRAK